MIFSIKNKIKKVNTGMVINNINNLPFIVRFQSCKKCPGKLIAYRLPKNNEKIFISVLFLKNIKNFIYKNFVM